MKRRDFINKATIAALAAKYIVLSSSQAEAMGITRTFSQVGYDYLPTISDDLSSEFLSLISWMKTNGWEPLVTQVSGLTLQLSGSSDPNLFKTFRANKVQAIGCDDFAGKQLISPGQPQNSLLYHLLASPRVRLPAPATAEDYPSLAQIDQLENFIYSLQTINAIDTQSMVLAMFSYEYRPSSKTPHGCHADLVFSRSAFSRIGTQPVSAYDKINRCYTNLPQNPELTKEIAAAPARYGLFLAALVPGTKVVNNAEQKANPNENYLLPVRKIFKNDSLIAGYDLYFEEAHINERLKRLCLKKTLVKTPTAVNFDFNKAPFIRRSSSSTDPSVSFPAEYDQEMVNLTEVGSSVLLSSYPWPLTRQARQTVNGRSERLRVQIPQAEGTSPLVYSNRRYTSLKLMGKHDQFSDAYNVLKDSVLYPRSIITDYRAPRNAPMFVYIRERVTEADGDNVTLLSYLNETNPDDLLMQTRNSYWVGLFEDNICDGCVFARLKRKNIGQQDSAIISKIMSIPLLPAFSIVSAPDFFPMVESYDMLPYRDLFISGGVEDTSSAKLKANPNIDLPGVQTSAFPNYSSNGIETNVQDTVFSIITGLPDAGTLYPGGAYDVVQASSQTRSNFLPDSATLIFFPGWDMTYSNEIDQIGEVKNTFYSTMGLGSPFMEDSKLCAAANGMWAAASPDSARTFRASLTDIPTKGLPQTAVPLLDIELGLHPHSPAVKDFGQMQSTGWDGEQGPFLLRNGNNVFVNFTDINKSDYVQNALAGQFDMSLMRQITIKEITGRMASLYQCYHYFRHKKNLWLVGAEKVANWQIGSNAYCIPANLFGASKQLPRPIRLPGKKDGYLYVFAETNGQFSYPEKRSKRMQQQCSALHIFLLSNNNIITYHNLNSTNNWTPDWI
ncbi:hypothetical protein [Mucilaginibacter sp. L196]|uniref:hypothetical protein n=1 Tax=Mucilaginibacter sp. L196 TaxID=1641870 RepID=UPI00131B3A60|nr:hypothetical protein [Mucilaginibacter sp. L196]